MVNRGIPLRELLVQQMILLNAVQLALRVSVVLRAIPQLLRQLRHQQLLRNRLVVVSQQRSTRSRAPFLYNPSARSKSSLGVNCSRPVCPYPPCIAAGCSVGFSGASNELANAFMTLLYVGSESRVLRPRPNLFVHGNAFSIASGRKHEVRDRRFGVERVDEIEGAENGVVVEHGEAARRLRRVEQFDVQKGLQRRLFFRIRRVWRSHRLDDAANPRELRFGVSSWDSRGDCTIRGSRGDITECKAGKTASIAFGGSATASSDQHASWSARSSV